MKRWRGVLIGGVLWAAAGIWFRLAVGESLSMASYSHQPAYSEFIDLMGADWVGLGPASHLTLSRNGVRRD
jgi:hypothetical protein